MPVKRVLVNSCRGNKWTHSQIFLKFTSNFVFAGRAIWWHWRK